MDTAPKGTNRRTIDAPPALVWSILEDPALLPRWVPVVEEVVRHAEREQLGAERRCNVAFGSKRGHIVERCAEAVPERLLRHTVVDDSLGFTKMFADYSFALELEPAGEGRTAVTISAWYEPRTVFARAMNTLVMRRKFERTRRQILDGLAELAEDSSRAIVT